MSKIHINIGSNKGDRLTYIESAVAFISSLWPEGRLRRSDFFESEPWGFESPNRFVNLGVMIETEAEADPAETLLRLQRVEKSISPDPHRDSSGGYTDRKIDIDLIAIDNITVESDSLTLPHPRMRERDFVMKPLCQLDPGWTDPVTGATALEIVRTMS